MKRNFHDYLHNQKTVMLMSSSTQTPPESDTMLSRSSNVSRGSSRPNDQTLLNVSQEPVQCQLREQQAQEEHIFSSEQELYPPRQECWIDKFASIFGCQDLSRCCDNIRQKVLSNWNSCIVNLKESVRNSFVKNWFSGCFWGKTLLPLYQLSLTAIKQRVNFQKYIIY